MCRRHIVKRTSVNVVRHFRAEAHVRDGRNILKGAVRTSGGSEADNQAVFGLTGRPLGRMLVSVIEHSAVLAPARELERQGFELAWAPAGPDGIVDVDAFAAELRPGDRMAAVMWANH